MLTDKLLTDVAEGRVTFDAFARQTSGDFAALAAHFARKYRGDLPGGMQLDDLVQEMLLSVHIHLQTFDPTKGSIAQHIVHRACCAARKAIGRCSRSQELDDRMQLDADVQVPIQEDVYLAQERRDTLPCDARQRAIVQSLFETGSFDLTTESLLAHPDTCSMFATPDPVRARHSVYRTARKLAQRAQATA